MGVRQYDVLQKLNFSMLNLALYVFNPPALHFAWGIKYTYYIILRVPCTEQDRKLTTCGYFLGDINRAAPNYCDQSEAESHSKTSLNDLAIAGQTEHIEEAAKQKVVVTGPLISAILVAILLQLPVDYNIGVMVRKAKGGRGGEQDTKHDEDERNMSSFHVHSVLYFLLVRIILFFLGGGGRGFIIIIQGLSFLRRHRRRRLNPKPNVPQGTVPEVQGSWVQCFLNLHVSSQTHA